MAIIMITTKHIEMRSKRIKRRVWGIEQNTGKEGKKKKAKKESISQRKRQTQKKKLDGKQRKLEEKDRKKAARKKVTDKKDRKRKQRICKERQRRKVERQGKGKTGKVEHSTGKERLKRVGSEKTKMKKCMLGTFLIQRKNSNKEEEENDARK